MQIEGVPSHHAAREYSHNSCDIEDSLVWKSSPTELTNDVEKTSSERLDIFYKFVEVSMIGHMDI